MIDDDDDEWGIIDCSGDAVDRATDAILQRPFDREHVTEALLAGMPDADERARARIAATVRLLVAHFGEGRRLFRDELAAALRDCPPLERCFEEYEYEPEYTPATGTRMQPATSLTAAFPLPSLTTTAELAAWLGLHDDELDGMTRSWRGDDARHYHHQWRPRRSAPPRLLEVPKPRLADVQRRIARHLLRLARPHAAAHGFVCGRSVATAMAPHIGRACVLRLDIEDCFASFGRGRVRRLLLNLGYPEPVADQLARLCTVATPRTELRVLDTPHHERPRRLREKLRRPHLPQGAPTSPALANLCAFAIDARLAGLARRFRANYTRYADDLVFSGDGAFARTASRCAARAAAILLEHGLHVAHHKTRVMKQGTAQRACGLVLNRNLALPRRQRERFEAILHNCVVHGPSTQNRERVPDFRAVLTGRVAHARRFDHSGRLARLFAAIDWTR